MDHVKKCVEVFKSRYPHLNPNDTTMFPKMFNCDFIGPINEGASGYTEITQIENVTIRGDNAEKLVFDALSKSSQPMLVIRGLKVTKFLQPILGDSIIESEIDFVIIHWKFGVLLLEVKASDSKHTYNKAREQLDKNQKIVKKLLEVLKADNTLPICKVYVTPNNEDNGHSKCKEYVRLDKESLENIPGWFKSNITQKELIDWEKNILYDLCCVLVCQKTELKTKVIPDVYEFIRRQRFLKQGCKKEDKEIKKMKKMKKNKTTDEPLEKKRCVISTKDHPDAFLLSDEFVFLNEEQLTVWKGRRHQIICGVAGSGKTLLLLYKALECALKGEKVKVVLAACLWDIFYQFFYEVHEIDTVTLVHADKLLESDISDFHIFIDEFQLSSRLNWFPLQLNDAKYFWLACDEMQVVNYGGNFRFNYTDSKSVGKLHTQLEAAVQDNGFATSIMSTGMRNSKHIHSFIQEYKKSLRVAMTDQYPPMNIGHNLWGEKVKVYLVKRKDNSLPIVESDIPSAEIGGISEHKNKEELFEHCVDIIKEEIEKNDLHDSCAILCDPNGWEFDEMYRILREKDVPFTAEEISSEKVFFSSCWSVHSFEWKTVFFIGQPEKFVSNYLAMTRAMCKLVVIFH